MIPMNVFAPADILLPASEKYEQWAVIACDQFTSDPAYWQRVRQNAADAPSTIHMILPEAELGGDRKAAAARINCKMEQYLDSDVFRVVPSAYIYVERTLQNGKIRPGLIGMVDLEQYDYRPGSVSPIRATEQTVLERIPPRQEIRKDAPVEFPHVLMLCDDPDFCLIEPVGARKDHFQKLYDFDLMESGGHITGWLVAPEDVLAFDRRFADFTANLSWKYSDLNGAKVLLAVGDGNHSLATAKSCYESLKVENPNVDFSNHPARFALVELENIHDESQKFEPIHRVILRTNVQKLLDYLSRFEADDGYSVPFVSGEGSGILRLDHKRGELAVAVLQELLDEYLSANEGEIDYIHGADEVDRLCEQSGAIGFILPPMEKIQLFRGVIAGGVLPRKTFSMGHAREKRYYLEGRKIR